jgi:hypothetical protein
VDTIAEAGAAAMEASNYLFQMNNPAASDGVSNGNF